MQCWFMSVHWTPYLSRNPNRTFLNSPSYVDLGCFYRIYFKQAFDVLNTIRSRRKYIFVFVLRDTGQCDYRWNIFISEQMNTNVSGKQNIMRKMCTPVYCVGLLALVLFRLFFDEVHSIFRNSDNLKASTTQEVNPITLKRIQGTEVRLTVKFTDNWLADIPISVT